MRDKIRLLFILLVALVATLGLSIGLICLGGRVLCDMWNWFVVPATNFNYLSYPIAVGLWLIIDGMFITYITSSCRTINTQYDEDDCKQLTVTAIMPYILLLCTWGIGAIIHFNM